MPSPSDLNASSRGGGRSDLASNGGQRQIDLADLTSTEASTLSRLVSRLIRMGLVTRTRSANSNREVVVKLSTKGQTLVARLIPIALIICEGAELAVRERKSHWSTNLSTETGQTHPPTID